MLAKATIAPGAPSTKDGNIKSSHPVNTEILSPTLAIVSAN